jgi:hypothetical protein
MTWIYLSKNSDDEYIDMYAHGLGQQPTPLETWRYEDSTEPLMLRGIMKHKIIKQCWADGRPFRYMDSGYLGNRPGFNNPHGWKLWHRVVPNNLQHDTVVPRPSDRWNRLGLEMSNRRRGSSILIVAPDEKPCKFYNIELDAWLDETVATIKQHTDRPIVIRDRTRSRTERKTNRLEHSLLDVHAVVTFNSIAATESVLAGVPVFVLAPCNAARPVANLDLTKIETPWFPDPDQIHAWAYHLAYAQFHINEFKNGTAERIIKQTEEMLNV